MPLTFPLKRGGREGLDEYPAVTHAGYRPDLFSGEG